MSVTLALLGIGTLARHVLQPGLLRMGFAALFGLYLLWRLKKPAVLAVWIVLSACTLFPHKNAVPQPGTYTIVEVKAGYALARREGVTVVCHTEEAVIYDEVELTQFEPLEGVHNIGLFRFADAMKAKGIGYQSEGKIVRRSASIQARLMNRFQENERAMSLLYGIRQEPSLLDQCGLPVLALLVYGEKGLRLVMEKKHARGTVILCATGFAWLFGWKASLLRFVLFKGIRLLWDDRLGSWGASIIAFSLLMPAETGGFSLVFPALLQLVSFLSVDKKAWFSRLVMMCLQTVYFGKVSLLSFFGFSAARLYAALLLGTLFLPVRLPVPDLDLSVPVNFNLIVFVVMITALVRWLLARKGKLTAVVLCGLLFFGQYADPFFHVYMVDIGQGDCTILVEPFMKSVVMIDCGQNLYRDNVEKIVVPFLEARKITAIDCLVVTHDDFDHAGGVEALAQKMPVKKIITERYEQVPVAYPFLSLLPDRECGDENQESIVSCFSYDGLTYLWMGDADRDIENQLLQAYPGLQTDVLKAGHHGSDTGTDPAFLDQTDPDICLISVGKNNRYGHPSPEVIHSLQSQQVDTFQTSVQGMVHISTFRGLRLLETASGYITFWN